MDSITLNVGPFETKLSLFGRFITSRNENKHVSLTVNSVLRNLKGDCLNSLQTFFFLCVIRARPLGDCIGQWGAAIERAFCLSASWSNGSRPSRFMVWFDYLSSETALLPPGAEGLLCAKVCSDSFAACALLTPRPLLIPHRNPLPLPKALKQRPPPPLQTSHVFPLRTQIHNSETSLISAIAFEFWKASNKGPHRDAGDSCFAGFHDTSWFSARALAVVKKKKVGAADGIWLSWEWNIM